MMLSGIRNDFLYASCRIETNFVDNKAQNICEQNGTGFFVCNSNRELCFITNRHMIQKKDYRLFSMSLSLRIKNSDNVTWSTITEKVSNISEFTFSDNPKNDIACLKNIKLERKAGGDAIKFDFFIKREDIADKDFFDHQLEVCDFVALAGYAPGYNMKTSSPVFRVGTIASDPRFPYSYDNEDLGNCVAYESFCLGGVSGSPVFSFQKGINIIAGTGIKIDGKPEFCPVRLIGVQATSLSRTVKLSEQITNQENILLSCFYRSDEIIKLIDK